MHSTDIISTPCPPLHTQPSDTTPQYSGFQLLSNITYSIATFLTLSRLFLHKTQPYQTTGCLQISHSISNITVHGYTSGVCTLAQQESPATQNYTAPMQPGNEAKLYVQASGGSRTLLQHPRVTPVRVTPVTETLRMPIWYDLIWPEKWSTDWN